MKKILMTLAAAFIMSATAFAQGGFGQGGQMPELTEEQRAQMEEARKKREEAQKEYDAELEKIMTPDQFKQYQEDQKNRRQRGFGGGQRGPRPQNG